MKKTLVSIFTAGLAFAIISTSGTVYAAKKLESDASVKFSLPEGYDYPIVEPLDPENPNNDDYKPDEGAGNKQVNKGPLSIDYASHISFGDQELSLDKLSIKSKTRAPYVQVTDQSFSEAGWTLSTSLTKFEKDTEEGYPSKSTLKGTSIQFNNTNANAKEDIKEHISSPKVESSFSLVSGEDAKNIATSNDESNRNDEDPSQGLGTWVITWLKNEDEENENSNVTLEVPAATATAGSHKAKINWILSSGPEALSGNN